MLNRPESTQVLVVGGGPAGSTAAALLAREGFDVVLAERDFFPRYHIGESLLPSTLDFLELLGAREKVEAHGFQRKPGAHIEWGSQQWDLFFGELSGDNTYSFQVIRSEFDLCLLDHAGEQGVRTLQGVEVREVCFDDERRAVGAILAPKGRPSQSWALSFDYLVDASGRGGLLSTRYLHSRYYHEVFQNVAVWGYWQEAKGFGGMKEGAIATVSISDGWIWAIPLHDGTMSVGVVLHRDTFKQRRAEGSVEELYHAAIADSQTISEMLAPARLSSTIQAETDYSYACDRFAGPGFFMAGDAACFLDPLLSTGVHLAMLSGLLAAASLCSLLRGEVDEEEAVAYYDGSFRRAYLRYLVFLSAFYTQYDGKESIFWMAQQLTGRDAQVPSLQRAFTSLMSGVEDLKDVREREVTPQAMLQEMRQRVRENLDLRKDKDLLQQDTERYRQARSSNGTFFEKVEGISVLSADDALDGLYVVAHPRLGLARTSSMPVAMAL